jgi:BirA family biotin operon repressor/biotin-[acetyl-CoA-carboxylase] ligase
VRLKWPNDLLLDGRKVGGILVEASASKAICGIGINLTWAPKDAATLGEPRDQLLEKLRIAMERWSAAPAGQVIAGWRQVSDTIGKRVRVELPDQVIEGIAEDIDPNGNLVVDGVRVSAGSVTVLGG